MKQRFLQIGLSLGLVALLGACSSSTGANPVSGGTDGFGNPGAENISDQDIPEALAGNLETVNFDPSADTLVISIGGLDSGSDSSTYARTPSLDVPGFAAFTKQDDPLDRFFLALATRSPDGTSQAFAITDGGQFNRYFGGSRFERIGAYTQPISGLVSYAGEYAGSTNLGQLNTAQLLPVPAGLGDNLKPRQPGRVRGNIFLNVGFSDKQINGLIYNRELISSDGTVAFAHNTDIITAGTPDMPNIALIATDINDDGTFAGTLEYSDTRDRAGEFAGTFGGVNASSVAGTTKFDEFTEAFEDEEEYGAFAIGRCGTAAASPICAGLGR